MDWRKQKTQSCEGDQDREWKMFKFRDALSCILPPVQRHVPDSVNDSRYLKKYNLNPRCFQLRDIILRIWWIWASIFRCGCKIRTLNTAAKCCNNILEVWSLAKSTFPSIPSARLSGQVRANRLYSHIIQQTAAQTSFYHQDIWETGPPRRYRLLTSQWLILYGSALPISPSLWR